MVPSPQGSIMGYHSYQGKNFSIITRTRSWV